MPTTKVVLDDLSIEEGDLCGPGQARIPLGEIGQARTELSLSCLGNSHRSYNLKVEGVDNQLLLAARCSEESKIRSFRAAVQACVTLERFGPVMEAVDQQYRESGYLVSADLDAAREGGNWLKEALGCYSPSDLPIPKHTRERVTRLRSLLGQLRPECVLRHNRRVVAEASKQTVLSMPPGTSKKVQDALYRMPG